MQDKVLVFDVDDTLYYDGGREVEKKEDTKIVNFLKQKLHLSVAGAHNFMSAARSCGLYDVDAVTPDMPFTKREFMDDVCDVDVSFLPRNEYLNHLLKTIPQRKFIITDGISKRVRAVLSSIAVDEDNFEGIFDGHDMDYVFKRNPQAFEMFLRKYNLQAKDCILFEDSLVNLQTAKSLGFTTVLIGSGSQEKYPFVDKIFPDIVTALESLKIIPKV